MSLNLVLTPYNFIFLSMRNTKVKDIPLPEMAFAEAQKDHASEMALCEAPQCTEKGEVPAPKSRNNLRDYRYFCLAHVREYNKNWNYFSGIEGDALEQAIRDASTWERPSWKFGTSGKGGYRPEELDDVFGFFDDTVTSTKEASLQALDPEERAAWALFGLDPTTDQAAVKKRYKQLVKDHHPDRHQGDEKAEEKLKEINLAYSLLRNKLATL